MISKWWFTKTVCWSFSNIIIHSYLICWIKANGEELPHSSLRDGRIVELMLCFSSIRCCVNNVCLPLLDWVDRTFSPITHWRLRTGEDTRSDFTVYDHGKCFLTDDEQKTNARLLKQQSLLEKQRLKLQNQEKRLIVYSSTTENLPFQKILTTFTPISFIIYNYWIMKVISAH